MTVKGGDGRIKIIVQIAFAVIVCELASKIYFADPYYWAFGGMAFAFSYIMCIITDVMGCSGMAMLKSTTFRAVLSILHGLDGVAALMIGVAIFYRNEAMLIGALVAMTKFYLIHLLNRMILANKKTDNFFDGVTQTTKSFLHHVASFIFLRRPTEIVITTVWRTISMSGHAALVLREHLSPAKMRLCHWGLAYLRISFQALLLLACLRSATLRAEFAHSAVGHVAYMMVRLEPVFQQGSMYLTAEEKEEWLALSGREKVARLCGGQHPWLATELALLTALVLMMSALRLDLLLHGDSESDSYGYRSGEESPIAGGLGDWEVWTQWWRWHRQWLPGSATDALS